MLRLVDCAVTYPSGVAALERATLDFVAGQFVVLLGPSGSGKSTFLRTLNGLVRPTQGDILLEGGVSIFASEALLRRHRRATGMIFQQHHLIGRMSALANVLLGRIGDQATWRSLLPFSRADRMLALAALDRVGLIERALTRVDQMSGGEQQRVGVARAMAQRPSLILADEPVASLDPVTAEKVLADLHRICREDGITAIVSLHQIGFAHRFADRIVGLESGRVVFDAAPNMLTPAALEALYGAPPTDARAAA